MKDITLVIPAKSESDSLPKVLNELKKFSVKKIIVIPKNDILTFKSAKKYNCKIIFQKKMDTVVLFPKEYFQLKQNTSVFLMLMVLLIQNILKK